MLRMEIDTIRAILPRVKLTRQMRSTDRLEVLWWRCQGFSAEGLIFLVFLVHGLRIRATMPRYFYLIYSSGNYRLLAMQLMRGLITLKAFKGDSSSGLNQHLHILRLDGKYFLRLICPFTYSIFSLRARVFLDTSFTRSETKISSTSGRAGQVFSEARCWLKK